MVEALTLPGDVIAPDPQGATLVFIYFPCEKRVFGQGVPVATV